MNNKTKIIADQGTSIVRIERLFDGSRLAVFNIFTKKELLERWWNPFGDAQVELDARVGGSWKFSGADVTFYGVFHEVTSPERIVQTSEYANLGERGHVILEKYDFIEQADDKTLVVITETFLSTSDRDGLLQSGMEQGLIKAYEKVDILLKERK